MLLHIMRKYPQRTFPGVSSMMGPIEDSLREAFYPAIFGEEEVSTDLREILGHSAKHVGLGITEPQLLSECAYNTSKSASEVLIGSLIGGTSLNYISHKECIHRASADRQKQRKFSETKALTIWKELMDRAGLNCLWRSAENGVWITSTPHRLNGMELSREEFQDNILLLYGIVPLNLPTECDGCGKKLLVPHAL